MSRRKGDTLRRVIALIIGIGIAVLAVFAVRFGIRFKEEFGEVTVSEAESAASAAEEYASSGSFGAEPPADEAVSGTGSGKKEENGDAAGKDGKKTADDAAKTGEILSEQTIQANQENAEILKGLVAAAIPDVSSYLSAVRGATSSSSRIICIDPARQAAEMTETERLGPGLSTRTQKMLPGSTGSVTGRHEYEVTLEIAMKLREELLRRGYNVVMTRETNDVELSEGERTRTAYLAGADILVHISCGFTEDSSVSGALAYAPTYESPSLENRLVSASQHLAEAILEDISSTAGMNNLGVLDGDDLPGINWAEVPVSTIQAGFLSNPEDEQMLTGEAGQSRIATGLANGIDDYFTALGGNGENTHSDDAGDEDREQ